MATVWGKQFCCGATGLRFGNGGPRFLVQFQLGLVISLQYIYIYMSIYKGPQKHPRTAFIISRGPPCGYITPLFTKFDGCQVVQDFSHQQIR